MFRFHRRQLTAIAIALSVMVLFAYGIGVDFTKSNAIAEPVHVTGNASIVGIQSILDWNN